MTATTLKRTLKYDPTGDPFERLAEIMSLRATPPKVAEAWQRCLEQREQRDALHARRIALQLEHTAAKAKADDAVGAAVPASDLLAAAAAIGEELGQVARAEAGADERLDLLLDHLIYAVNSSRRELLPWLAEQLGNVDQHRNKIASALRGAAPEIEEFCRQGGAAAWIASPLFGEQPRLNGPLWSINGLDATAASTELDRIIDMLVNASALVEMQKIVDEGEDAAKPQPETPEQKRGRRAAYGKPNEDWED